MTDRERAGSTWLKYGCIGCASVLTLILVAALAVFALARREAESIEAVETRYTREIPAPGDTSTTGISPEALSADLPDADERLRSAPPGLLVLDLSGAEFFVNPGAPGEPLRVEGSFDPDMYELTERFERTEDRPWMYRVSFRKTGQGSFIQVLAELLSGAKPRVDIFIPPDHPLSLDLKTTQGGALVDLGGLWITDADLEFAMGGIELDFSEPVYEPIDHIVIQGRMGGGSIRSLGNASPRRLDIDYSMGGMELDLRGRWLVDAEITISTSMAGGLVRLPRGVHLRGLDTAPDDGGSPPPPDAPTLSFTASSEMGELEIVR